MVSINGKMQDRRQEIAKLAADKALELPVLPSGFWFHKDLRDNFYYAVHLFAFCVDSDFAYDWNDENRTKAKSLSLDILKKILALQVTDPHDPMYGHWPLNLGNNPSEAKPNPLPFEILGCLLILFYKKYGNELPSDVNKDCYLAIEHLYKSNIYRQPLKHLVHHEAKHTSLKLLLAHLFEDRELMEQGLETAKRQFAHIRKFGFKEYGSLPWFWHWVQAFTCVWEVVEDAEVRITISDLLQYLWGYRVDYYLQGTWAGAHSRQSSQEVPKDNNILLDYIQFGDFPLPKTIVRLEGSALYSYRVQDEIVRQAVARIEPIETKQKIQFASADEVVLKEAHTYLFKTSFYAVGGIWERMKEFDNEQHRWDITFPLTQNNIDNSVNQAFFFHPGEKYFEGDDRHASSFGEVMFHQDAVIQIWHVPLEEKEAYPNVIGCLPKGEWKFENLSGYGRVEDAYLFFQLMNEFKIEEKKDRISIEGQLTKGWNGIVIEAVSCKDALSHGIHDADSFAKAMREKNKSVFTSVSSIPDSVQKVTSVYNTWRNDGLSFSLDNQGNMERLLNGKNHSFHDYQI